MLSPQLGQAAFRIAFMMVAMSALMALFLTPGTAEYVISIVTLVLGLVFMGIVFILVRVIG
jgi:preprotein translocase subunit Sss1